MTTQVNTYEKNIKSLKVGTLKADKITVGKEWVPWAVTTFQAGNVIGTGATLKTSEFRYRLVGTTLHMKGQIYITGGATTSGASGSAHSLSLPTGCIARASTSTATYPVIRGVGTFIVVGNTKTMHGTVDCDPDPSHNYLNFNGVTTGTDVATVAWGSAADAELKFNATPLSFGFTAQVELDPTSAILSGNLVP